nr:reverse transcriptase domain-containing protein [Tanacetum cinerariifolium]
MANNRTMAELLQAPTKGYEDAIVILEIAANNFELKHGLINLVQKKQFFGHDKEDPHAHIRYFNMITSTMRVPNVPTSSIKLMIFPFSLEGAARIWLEKEAPRSILTWDDLVTKFINQFFPPSKKTNLRNEITRFQQRFDESFYEAWDRFNDLLRACPHHGFFELHQLDTFYNALNINDQDSLNSAAGGNFLDKMPRECLKIIESKSKVRQSRAKAVVVKVSTSSSTSAISSEVSELKDLVRALLLDKKTNPQLLLHLLLLLRLKQLSRIVSLAVALTHTKIVPLLTKTFIETTSKSGNFNQGQLHRPQVNQPLAYQAPIPQTLSVTQTDFESYIKANDAVLRNMQSQGQGSGSGTLPSKTKPKEDLKGITTRSGVAYQGPQIPTKSKVVKQGTEVTKDQVQTSSSQSTAPVQPPAIKSETQTSEHVVDPDFHFWNLLRLCMTLELADRSVSKPIGIAKDVSVKVGVFHFPADFVVVDFEPDPRVPLILGRCFLKTGRALIDVHKVELTLRIGSEAITYNLDQTVRYSANYNQMTANKINVICEIYSQKVLGFSDVTASGNPTPYDDPIISTTSPTLTPFGDSDFLLFEEADAFLAILNSEPLPPLPTRKQYMPSYKKELKVCEAKTVKSSVDEPPEVELKDLPPHLEYTFLVGDNKLPVIIAKELGDEENSALIKVLKSNKRAIAWKLFDR